MIFIPVVLLIIGIGVFLASYILTSLGSSFGTLSTPAADALADGAAAVNTFNYGFVIIAFGLGIGAVAYGYLYPSHPIFIVLGIVMMVFSMITTPMISNAFGTFVGSDQMSTVAGNFPLITWLMGDTLPIFITVFGALIIIVMYSRLRSGTS